MPELVEVEFWRRTLARLFRGTKLVALDCANDSTVLPGLTAALLRKNLLHRTISNVCRRGKHLWLEFEQPSGRAPMCLWLHFAMSGNILVRGEEPMHLVDAKAASKAAAAPAWPPNYAKLWFTNDRHTEAAFVNVRRFGRVRMVENVTRACFGRVD